MTSLMNPGDRLVRVPLGQLHPHPRNANLMSEERQLKLLGNIEREGRYPPLIARPHPELADEFELLDGRQRYDVLKRLGHQDALCYVWPCDDATALLLLATLNRLEGEDVPARRGELLSELTGLLSAEELALLLPEDAAAIEQTLDLVKLDGTSLLIELEEASRREGTTSPKVITFSVHAEHLAVVEEALRDASTELSGPNRRGRALALICQSYLEGSHA